MYIKSFKLYLLSSRYTPSLCRTPTDGHRLMVSGIKRIFTCKVFEVCRLGPEKVAFQGELSNHWAVNRAVTG